jgi:hypothetical protein
VYYVKRGVQVRGPFDLEKILKAVQDEKLLLTDQFSEKREGPWCLVSQLLHSSQKAGTSVRRPAQTIASSGPPPQRTDAAANHKLKSLGMILGICVSLVALICTALALLLSGGKRTQDAASVVHREAISETLKPRAIASENEGTKIASANSEPQTSSPKPAAQNKSTEVYEVLREASRPATEARTAGDETAIKNLLQSFMDAFDVSLKETYALCVPDDTALALLSDFQQPRAPRESILSFDGFPEANVLEEARSSARSVRISFKRNGEPRTYYVQAINGSWRINYIESLKSINGFDREFPVTIGIMVRRRPRQIPQHEVIITVVNDTQLPITVMGDVHNVAEKKDLFCSVEPGRLESKELTFISPMLVQAAEDSEIVVGCDVFPRGYGVDSVMKKLFTVQFIIDGSEFDKVKVITRQPHKLVRRSETD